MTGIFSKLKQMPSSAPKKENVPTSTRSKPTAEHASFSKKTWLFGILLALLLLLLLVAMAISLRQTRNNTAHLEIVARIQMHSQRLTKASQQTILGHEAAFAQLQDSKNQLNHFIILLTQGGLYRGNNISAFSNGPPTVHFETYIKQWRLEEKKINLILASQESLVNLGHVVRKINTANGQLLILIDQMIKQLEQIGDLSNEIVAIEAMKVLIQSVTKSVNTVLPSQFPISEVKGQLAQDRNRFSAIIQVLNQGSTELSLPSIKDKIALERLSQIQRLFRGVDNNIGIVQKEIANVITIKFATNEIFKNSEVMLSMTQTLDDELQKQDAAFMSLLNMVLYISTALVVVTIFLFARAITQHTRSQLLASKNEIDRTQKAILRLLDDMGKLADGDLTVRTDVTEDITGAIADSINYTIEELHTLVEEVNKSSTQVAEASKQAQHISSELLTAAQQQSLKIEETTIAVLGIAESISDVSDTAEESARVAKRSLATAEKGSIAVRESIAGMNEIRTHIQDTSKRIKRLGESSQEIGEIVALISDITEQTNVLALNAAIQAASAGEAGRGFTVIAQEVQRLAERSADATKQVSSLVKTIQGDTQDTIAAMERSTHGVAKGAKRSDAAGQALEEIEKVSKHLAQHVTSIFDATHAQTQAANKVVENMEDILHITRQTTDGTMQTTISIKQITGSASELKASVSNFKV
tara:strand:+ start:2002 stop:4104 length:2103 start_codon:yes stop_codon:yes gene_type:complete